MEGIVTKLTRGWRWPDQQALEDSCADGRYADLGHSRLNLADLARSNALPIKRARRWARLEARRHAKERGLTSTGITGLTWCQTQNATITSDISVIASYEIRALSTIDAVPKGKTSTCEILYFNERYILSPFHIVRTHHVPHMDYPIHQLNLFISRRFLSLARTPGHISATLSLVKLPWERDCQSNCKVVT